jgi:hypothetical protein
MPKYKWKKRRAGTDRGLIYSGLRDDICAVGVVTEQQDPTRSGAKSYGSVGRGRVEYIFVRS